MSSTPIRPETVTIGELYTLRDDAAGSCAVVAPQRGAIVTSFQVGGRELLYMEEATLHDPTKNVRGGIPVLFPSPGKLTGDTFRYQGRVGTDLKQHGIARLMPWQVERSVADELALTLTDDSRSLACFPWSFQAGLRYRLRGRTLTIEFRLRNTDSVPMPFALGFHPYFGVADQQAKARTTIPTQATRAFDNQTKQVVPFRGFDLTQREVDLHLLDHGSGECVLRMADGSSIRLSAAQEFVIWVIWTLADRSFVCVEPWTARADALNTTEHLLLVEPGAERSLTLDIEFIPAPRSA
jgi:galactose mutarotase-like enzyme